MRRVNKKIEKLKLFPSIVQGYFGGNSSHIDRCVRLNAVKKFSLFHGNALTTNLQILFLKPDFFLKAVIVRKLTPHPIISSKSKTINIFLYFYSNN